MPDYTRPATWEDVKQLARYFEEAGVEYALIGGYALAAHGLARFTQDVDVLVDPAATNSQRWIAALSRLPDDVRIKILDLPGLLKTKEVQRAEDQADAEAIRCALELLQRK